MYIFTDLRNEQEACVAMVNHPEHAELTIFSERTLGSSMYKWNKNGQVESISPVPFSDGDQGPNHLLL